ncbi:CU044_5270 family protein [Spirillospora sp. NPDC049652]
MDEMTLVEQVFTEPAAGPDVAAAGRARLLGLAGGAEPGPRRRRARPRPRWLLGAGLLPVGAAGVAAVMLAGHGAAPASRPPDRQARSILLVAAERTASAPAAGRYFRFTTEEGQQHVVGSKDHPYKIVTAAVEEEWYPVAAGVRGWSVRRELAARPLTPVDAAAWRAAGSPARVRQVCDDDRVVGYRGGEVSSDSATPPIPVKQRCGWFSMRPGSVRSAPMSTAPGMPGTPPAGLDVAKLSDDTATLRRQLLAWTRSGGLMGPVEGDSAQLWTAALYVIADPIGPVRPAVRAATYRVLADLPDVRSLGTVTDQKGRRGQALTRDGKSSEGIGTGTYRLVIDPDTGAPLETTSTGSDFMEYTSVLDFGYTDETPPSAKN